MEYPELDETHRDHCSNSRTPQNSHRFPSERCPNPPGSPAASGSIPVPDHPGNHRDPALGGTNPWELRTFGVHLAQDLDGDATDRGQDAVDPGSPEPVVVDGSAVDGTIPAVSDFWEWEQREPRLQPGEGRETVFPQIRKSWGKEFLDLEVQGLNFGKGGLGLQGVFSEFSSG